MGNTCSAGNGDLAVSRQYDYVDRVTRKHRAEELHLEALHGIEEEDLDSHQVFVWETCKSNMVACDLKSAANAMAGQIVKNAKKMAIAVAAEPNDVLDKQWLGVKDPKEQIPIDPLTMLLGENNPMILSETIIDIVEAVKNLLVTGPTLQYANIPAKVYGDLHGQFRDFLLLLHDFEFPHPMGQDFIFNGDWVDRGAHQLEVVTLVFAFKLAFPDKVKLVRGNHEDVTQSQHMGAYGFQQACIKRLGEESGSSVFEAFADAFEWLPLGCVIDHKILVVHGGVGDGDWDLSELASVQRPISNRDMAENEVVYNVLWSDPIPETKDESTDCFGVHSSPRDNHANLVHMFGSDVTRDFCERNSLEMVIRSHQAIRGGHGYEIMHGGHVVRVFSARDYEGNLNDGSVLSIRATRGKTIVRPQIVKSLAH